MLRPLLLLLFADEIPAEIGQLSSLVALALEGNMLKGKFVQNVRQLGSLRRALRKATIHIRLPNADARPSRTLDTARPVVRLGAVRCWTG